MTKTFIKISRNVRISGVMNIY